MKKYLITGLVILMPVALTLFVIAFLFDFFTAPFVSLVSDLVEVIQTKLPFMLPEGLSLFLAKVLSLLFTLTLIFVLGIFGRWFLIKAFLTWFNKAVDRIPLISSVYKISRDIISALFSADGKKVFKEPVMVPFPDNPNYCLGFSTGEAPLECEKKMGKSLISVFAPTAPHPISGFLFILPKEEAHTLDMTNEDMVKYLVSCGVILPVSETNGHSYESF